MLARHGRTNNGQELSLQPTAHDKDGICVLETQKRKQHQHLSKAQYSATRQLRRVLPQHSEPTAASSAIARDAIDSPKSSHHPPRFQPKLTELF